MWQWQITQFLSSMVAMMMIVMITKVMMMMDYMIIIFYMIMKMALARPREMSLLRHMLLNLIVDLLDCITEILQSLEQKYKNSKLLVNRAGHKQEQEK